MTQEKSKTMAMQMFLGVKERIMGFVKVEDFTQLQRKSEPIRAQ